MPTPEEVGDIILGYFTAITNRVSHTFDGFIDLPASGWLRLVVVVGGYILVRPLLVKLGAYIQDAESRKVMAAEKKEEGKRVAAKREARIKANALRGVPEDAGEKEEGATSGAATHGRGSESGWFGGARKRGKGNGKGKWVPNLLNEEEERQIIIDAMQSDDDAEDVADLLTRTE